MLKGAETGGLRAGRSTKCSTHTSQHGANIRGTRWVCKHRCLKIIDGQPLPNGQSKDIDNFFYVRPHQMSA
jgi:hypothetical protein